MTYSLRTIVSIAAGPILALAACLPFTGCIPWGPQSASATPEFIARSTVPAAEVLAGAAQIGELIPGVSVPATVLDRFAEGYTDFMSDRIDALEARIAQGQPVGAQEWWWAIALAIASGSSNIFSFRAGQQRSKP